MTDFTLIGAFGAGILTFVSPCVLPMAPIIIASLLTTKNGSRFERLKVTLWFSAGFSVVFVLMGLSLPWVTDAVGAGKPWLVGISGVVLAVFGARMMGWFGDGKIAAFLTRSVSLPAFVGRLPKGVQGLGFGALFGLTWTPCVGPVLGGVLTYVASHELSSSAGAMLLATFSAGVTIPFILLAVASESVSPLLNKLKPHLPRLEYVAGLMLFAFGAYVISQARLQDFATSDSRNTQVVARSSTGSSISLGDLKPGAARMVFFYSDSCPICHAMEKYLPEFEKSCVSPGFEFVRVNIDHSENDRAARHFGVKAVPTVSVLNDRGKEVVHLVGYQTESRLREAAKTFTKLACANEELKSPESKDLDRAIGPGMTCGTEAAAC